MTSRFVVAVAAVSLAACSTGDNKGSLTRLSEVSASEKCPAGGVVIAAGLDTNQNHTLDDAEVQQSTEICNGATGQVGVPGGPGASGDGGTAGFSTLVLTTNLAFGDSNCPAGGVRLDYGLDDGTGNGTARNGTLETGEILGTRYLCNGADPMFPGSLVPPASPAGQFAINANGGAGSNGAGGPGGNIYLRNISGSRGGHVKVFKTGLADANFTLGTAPAFVAGATPMVVNSSLAMTVYATTGGGITGGSAFFMVTGNDTPFANVAGVATPVTSLTVAAGVTLTLALNNNETASLSVPRDIKNLGTITTEGLEDGSTGAIELGASNFYGEPGSKVDLSSAGENGGSLDISVGSRLVNQGLITTKGGVGFFGGNGGDIGLYASPGFLTNTGTIDARGGNSNNGPGANGGSVIVSSGYHDLRNSGSIDTSGGSGTNAGGNAGSIWVGTDSVGKLLNSGALTAKGGTCSATNCLGGNGATIELSNSGADLVSSGSLDCSGAAGQGTFNGGTGGRVRIVNGTGAANYGGGFDLPTGTLTLSGNVTTSGGAGAVGGTGGDVEVQLDVRSLAQGQEVVLLGYTTLSAMGGAGTSAAGGGGGTIELSNGFGGEGGPLNPAGAAINHANVIATGGAGSQGGRGGNLRISTQDYMNFNNPWEKAWNLATSVDLSGGAGNTLNGGYGGDCSVSGGADADNQAAITTNGGNASGVPTITSGGGGTVTVTAALGKATNSGAVTSNGGSSSGNGNNGGYVEVAGVSVVNSGAITANGGNATLIGGSGGFVELVSSPTPTATSSNSGALSVNAGNGATPGSKGTVLLDGNDITP